MTQTRQSPSSSRVRSTTIVRSSGTAPRGGRLVGDVLEQVLGGEAIEIVIAHEAIDCAAGGRPRSSRTSRPMASPSSRGRAGPSAFQNGIFPGSPGAGETITRSCVISSMRQLEAPRTKVSPTRHSKTISSSSSPTRAVPFGAPARNTP